MGTGTTRSGAFEKGNLPQARDNWEDALSEAEQIGALPLQMILLNNLGETAYQMSKISDARHHIERAMTLANEMEDQRSKVEILRNLALVELKEGNSERARALALSATSSGNAGGRGWRSSRYSAITSLSASSRSPSRSAGRLPAGTSARYSRDP